MARFFITTPIYYVNDVPHIGSAYTTLASDVLARAHRHYGDEVHFITGTDEHGTKIALKAEAARVSPKEYADTISAEFRTAWHSLGIEPDLFVRTTAKHHEHLVGQVMELLRDKKMIYEGQYSGWYCIGCEEYKEVGKQVQTRSVEGGESNALMGNTSSQNGDIPLCEIHLTPLEYMEESLYYFALSQFQQPLIELIESDTLQIKPVERKNEVLSFLKQQDLRDIPVTRSKVSWGIPLPFDNSQTVYVWFDALLNYLSFSSSNASLEAVKSLQTCWPADLQLLGKDILRFHAVIWPALLLALELPLPKSLFVHGFFTINGQKMSKSLGNVIRPAELIERYGSEATRYLILSAVPYGADGDISIEKMDLTYTANLANGLGNLVQRTLVLLNKFSIRPNIELKINQRVKSAYLENDLTEAIYQLDLMVNEANRYIAAEAPWAMENEAERQVVLTKLYADLATIAEALTPLMPETSAKIQAQLASFEPAPLFPRLV